MTQRSDTTFMNGVPELLVLRLLSDREMYGYELVTAIRAATGDSINLGEGVVYPALHALEGGGHLTSRRATVDGRVRVYYRLTRKGRKRLAAVTDRWSQVARSVMAVLTGTGGEHVQPSI